MEKTKDENTTAHFQNGKPLLPRASGSRVPPAARSADHRNKYGNDAIPEEQAPKDGAGIPAGYKPDTSVQYVAGKGDKPDQVKDAKGTRDVSTENTNMAGNAMETLPPGHTYRDRVEAQARSLGVEVVEGETLNLLMWKIQMQASS